MKKRSLYFLFLGIIFLSLNQASTAQVIAPQLICIKNDTLKWEPASITCGPFISYDIYFSTDFSIPFSLLISITDPDLHEFFHENITAEKRYYYLKGNYNCPGEIFLSSDTLDNRLPLAEAISSVSVENNNVLIRWTKSPSPETIGYIIYKITDIGTIPIDTVFDINNYLDLNSNPSTASESYYVNALDACGNTSLFGIPHQTIFLEVNQEDCKRSADLQWSPYSSWPEGAAYQEVWVETNNGTALLVEKIAGNAGQYSYKLINDSTNYCFYIKSVREDLQDSSWSNAACFYTDIIQPVRNFVITNASFTEEEDILLTWNWNTNAELEEVKLLRGESISDLQVFSSFFPGFPLDSNPSEIFEQGTASSSKNYFQVSSTDLCLIEEKTPIASPVLLTVNVSNDGNYLSWLPLQLPGSIIESYQVYKKDGSFFPSLIETLSPNVESYTEQINPFDEANDLACYYVEASGAMILPDSSTLPFVSRSNSSCAKREPTIFMPNAFMPRGKFPEFKPVIRFDKSIDTYSMEVYDRWGKRLFFSADPDIGWRGKDMNGNDIKQGLYPYRIQYQLTSGEEFTKKGTVTLLR